MLSLKAPAKINWFLKIRGMRQDGYHEIFSLMQKVSLYDTLQFSPANKVKIICDADIRVEDNLVYRAAVLMKETYGVSEGAIIRIKKRIPVGAGLGGGSSDAATTLLGLNRLWKIDLSQADLLQLAESIGSDVPFFIYGACALVSGRGEIITREKSMKKRDILLVKPDMSISTAWAYKKYSELTKKPEKVNNIEHFIRNIENAQQGSASTAVLNDLEAATAKEFPVIDDIKDKLRSSGSCFTLMSGSGPTVFGVFESRAKVREASQNFKDYWTSVVETIID